MRDAQKLAARIEDAYSFSGSGLRMAGKIA